MITRKPSLLLERKFDNSVKKMFVYFRVGAPTWVEKLPDEKHLSTNESCMTLCEPSIDQKRSSRTRFFNFKIMKQYFSSNGTFHGERIYHRIKCKYFIAHTTCTELIFGLPSLRYICYNNTLNVLRDISEAFSCCVPRNGRNLRTVTKTEELLRYNNVENMISNILILFKHV